jgi:hypothetical protein
VAAYLCVVELAGMVVKNDICPGGRPSLAYHGGQLFVWVVFCVALCFACACACVRFPFRFVRASRGPVRFLCFYALVLLAAFGVAFWSFAWCLDLSTPLSLSPSPNQSAKKRKGEKRGVGK